jgi:FKBP-type peptidyl-prolyl cis-trans isomerase
MTKPKTPVLKILVGVLLVLAAFAAIWWLALYRPAQLLAAANAEAAATQAQQAERRAGLFGDEALAADVQWRDTGFGYRIIAEGTGAKPIIGTKVRVNYVGRLKDGTVFDRSSSPRDFQVGGLIPGMNAGLQLLGSGGQAVFFIPPKLGYGGRATGPIPANSGLIFEVELVEVLR